MSTLKDRLTKIPQIVTLLVVAALVFTVVFVFVLSGNGKKTLTVEFPFTNSVYVGSDVRIFGVAVGRVTALEPAGDRVIATLEYDSDIDLPADVNVAVISPAIIGDRFVQLDRLHTEGEVLADGATIPLDTSRVKVPVELDEIYASLSDLAVNLGPDGINEDGALAAFIDNQAELLGGRGAELNETIRNFARLSETLANNADPLFSSLREVNEFVALLQRNDAQVRSFNTSTQELAQVLADERENLTEVLRLLGTTLIDVDRFVRANQDTLRANVENLTTVTALLSKHQESLLELTVAGPVAYSNLAFTYNPYFGTLDNHADILEAITGLLTPCTLSELLESSALGDLPVILDLIDLIGGAGECPNTGRLGDGSGSQPESENNLFLQVPSSGGDS